MRSFSFAHKEINTLHCGRGYSRLCHVAILAALFVFCSAGFAAAETVEREISLSNAPMTMDQALERALQLNRTLKAARIEVGSSEKKVDETRAQFGLNLEVDSTLQYVKDSTSLGLPIITYKPIGFVYPSPTAPIMDVTNIDPVTHLPTPFTEPQLVSGATPSIMFKSTKLNNKWQDGAELKLTKPLFTFGKKKAAVNSAKKGRDIKNLDVELSKLDLILKVKETFLGYLLAEKAVATQTESVKRTQAQLEAAQARYDAGASPKLDVIRAQGDLEQSRESLIQAQKNHELAGMALANTIGLPVTEKLTVSDSGIYKVASIKPLDFYLEKALAQRQELKQLDLARELAALSATLSKNKPMIALAGIWTFESNGSAFSAEDSIRTVISAQFPIFDNGLASSKVAQARNQQSKLDLSRTDLTEGINLQVKQAYLNVIEAQQRIETSAAILKTAEEGYRMADLGFKEGVTAQIDLVDVEQSLTLARLNRAKADHDYEVAKAQLARACAMESLEK